MDVVGRDQRWVSQAFSIDPWSQYHKPKRTGRELGEAVRVREHAEPGGRAVELDFGHKRDARLAHEKPQKPKIPAHGRHGEILLFVLFVF